MPKQYSLLFDKFISCFRFTFVLYAFALLVSVFYLYIAYYNYQNNALTDSDKPYYRQIMVNKKHLLKLSPSGQVHYLLNLLDIQSFAYLAVPKKIQVEMTPQDSKAVHAFLMHQLSKTLRGFLLTPGMGRLVFDKVIKVSRYQFNSIYTAQTKQGLTCHFSIHYVVVHKQLYVANFAIFTLSISRAYQSQIRRWLDYLSPSDILMAIRQHRAILPTITKNN